MKRLTIYDIKYLSQHNSPYFFSHESMKFFGQTLKSFSVKKLADGNYLISSPMIDKCTGRNMGTTKRIFNITTNCLELTN